MDDATRVEFERMWFAGVKLDDIASTLGITKSIVSKARQKYGLPKRCKSIEEDGETPPPQIISLRCAEVRTAWDFVTYKLRWQGTPSTHYVE